MRLHLYAFQTVHPGFASGYTDDLPNDEQIRFRDEQPVEFFWGLSPPMRAAVATAIEEHDRLSAQLSTQAPGWIRPAVAHASETQEELDPTSKVTRQQMRELVSKSSLQNRFLHPPELSTLHLWDAYRLVCAPQSRFEQGRLQRPGSIGAAPPSPTEQQPVALGTVDRLRDHSGASAWGYHHLSWLLLEKVLPDSTGWEPLRDAWEAQLQVDETSPDLLNVETNGFREKAALKKFEYPWASAMLELSATGDGTKTLKTYLAWRRFKATQPILKQNWPVSRHHERE